VVQVGKVEWGGEVLMRWRKTGNAEGKEGKRRREYKKREKKEGG
jgi:hypothetical protein